MSKFNDAYNRILFEELNKLPTVDEVLPQDMCNPSTCFKWVKGQANVYGCMITAENLEAVTNFLQVREMPELKPQIGKFVVYNPNIAKEDGQIWTGKAQEVIIDNKKEIVLKGYTKATPKNSAFGSTSLTQDGLKFDEYIFIPKEDPSTMVEGEDWWYGFQIPVGIDFIIQPGCGNNGADGSTAYATDWLPIVNGKFDWARSRGSMKRSNYICVEKGNPEIAPEALENWNNFMTTNK